MCPKDPTSQDSHAVDNTLSQQQVDQEKLLFESEERRLKLKNLKVDLLVKPLSFLSAVFAFALAYIALQAHYSQTEKSLKERYILEEKIGTTQTPINTSSSLVVVEVDLTNQGGDILRPYAHALVESPLYKNEGLYFIIYEIPTQPNRLIGDQEGEAVYGPHNMLEQYSKSPRKWYESYRIKPHTTYHESQAVILERGKLYQVLVRFFALYDANDASTITESRYFYVN